MIARELVDTHCAELFAFPRKYHALFDSECSQLGIAKRVEHRH